MASIIRLCVVCGYRGLLNGVLHEKMDGHKMKECLEQNISIGFHCMG